MIFGADAIKSKIPFSFSLSLSLSLTHTQAFTQARILTHAHSLTHSIFIIARLWVKWLHLVQEVMGTGPEYGYPET